MIEDLLQPRHLLELGKGLAEGIRNFKDALKKGSEPESPAKPPAE